MKYLCFIKASPGIFFAHNPPKHGRSGKLVIERCFAQFYYTASLLRLVLILHQPHRIGTSLSGKNIQHRMLYQCSKTIQKQFGQPMTQNSDGIATFSSIN
ncbi:hypothetical protein [uncultured Chitinophaga sp.]|uniref:hypothetical protein n=1 Tax=uncultured Chitinophaga sp. TaxID=339340 RepID=UPI0025D4F980|nr:hypothetical protein [uncultured Chitinophaga sp.]